MSVYRTIGPLVFSSVSVAEWPPFVKSVDHMACSLCILTICNISYFPFWVLLASVSDPCILLLSINAPPPL